jgi:hypothetical protein
VLTMYAEILETKICMNSLKERSIYEFKRKKTEFFRMDSLLSYRQHKVDIADMFANC